MFRASGSGGRKRGREVVGTDNQSPPNAIAGGRGRAGGVRASGVPPLSSWFDGLDDMPEEPGDGGHATPMAVS
ncbi:MAG TPA: hypothetical protein VIU11_16670 [Nakamurella sp.]